MSRSPAVLALAIALLIIQCFCLTASASTQDDGLEIKQPPGARPVIRVRVNPSMAPPLQATVNQNSYQMSAKQEARLQKRAAKAARKNRLAEFDGRVGKGKGRIYAELPMTRFKLEAKKVRMLSGYRLELILDCSLSMRKHDCPGNMSRWDWCGYQAADLARALSAYRPEGLTVTPFGGTWDVYKHVKPQDVVRIFAQHRFTRGTRMYEPLHLRLGDYFSHRGPDSRPLLVAVITDGVPYPVEERQWVRDELINAGRMLKRPGEVTIVFLQIGGASRKGRNYLLGLANDLKGDGVPCPYVHTKTFDELVRIGLAQALVDSIEQFAPPEK